MIDDVERCYRAVASRDERFDGWFVTAVTSTGIYCRPSCPARTPGRANVRFHPTAAAAQAAGFRACKRCRPDATPGSPEWDVRGDVVGRAMRLIADGTVDREGVPGLARRLGYSERHLNRLLADAVGAGPLALARAQRAQTARVLIETTDLPLSQIAFAAGFASVRQFNDTVRAVFAATPTLLRGAGRRGVPAAPGMVSLRLPHRTPMDAVGLMARLVAHAAPGLEEGGAGSFRRTLRLPHGAGTVALSPEDGHIGCRLRLADVRDLAAAVARCRRLLDLDADPVAVDAALAADAALAPAVAARPGVRVPRTVDADELAVRAVLSQQVSVAAARRLTADLMARFGTKLETTDGGLTHVFPSAHELAEADLSTLPMPRRRQETVARLAAALATGEVVLDPGADRAEAAAALARLPGIGPWTVDVIVQRGLGDPDVVPVGDLAIRRGAEELGLPATAEALERHGVAWRPWRSYAAQHLWNAAASAPTRPIRTTPLPHRPHPPSRHDEERHAQLRAHHPEPDR